MKIFIPVSHNGGGDGKTGWAVSLATSFNGRHVLMEDMGGSHADRQCNQMANRLLKTDCDVMLIIDIDTEFTEQDVARAVGHMERGLLAVWGLYPKKEDSCPPCVNTWPEVGMPDEHGLINVRRAGRGFLMVHRSVFERLKEENGGPAKRFHNHGQIEWAFFRSGVVDGAFSAVIGDVDAEGYPLREWISEDWMFCEDLRIHLRIPTLVDTGIILAHVGSKTYRFPVESLVRVGPPKTWRDIHGWFDYEPLYRMIVNEIPDWDSFTEVGTWLGKSFAAFHSFAKEAGKAVLMQAVDTFQGEPASTAHAEILALHGGNVEKAFLANMEALGVGMFTAWPRVSVDAAAQFGNESQFAVFIDADHREEYVAADIAAWLPKVKRGGILAGHDYDEPGVIAAVAKAGLKVETMGRCWVHRKT